MTTYFALGNESVPVIFDPEKIAPEYYDILREIIAAENGKNGDAYGKAVVKMMTLVFGEKNTEKVFAYYKNDAARLVNEMVLFLGRRLAPIMKKASKKNAMAFRKWWRREAHRKTGDARPA